jgi:hypothetical protein
VELMLVLLVVEEQAEVPAVASVNILRADGCV